jgi:hypothetical protein
MTSTEQTSFADYTAALEAGDTPLLGHLVLYSVFDGRVTRDDLVGWFAELGLNPDFLPAPIRPIDAFEKVTGPDGVRASYSVDDPTSTGPRRRRRTQDGHDREATLMVRHVRRDGGQVVRHVVREVRDEHQAKLSYDTRLGEAIFRRDSSSGSAHGAGAIEVTPDNTAIAELSAPEQAKVRDLLAEIHTSYRHHCTFLTGDRLRSVVRNYIEHLHAIRVRPTGGVYFVHQHHADTLAALRTLISRLGAGSHLVRVPIPDQDEMREMVIAAFTTRAQDDLNRLARDIAAAGQSGDTNSTALQALHKRFVELQAATSEHSELLNTSLDDADSALQLVQLQLSSLLAKAA